jgi:hypothetical protein
MKKLNSHFGKEIDGYILDLYLTLFLVIKNPKFV